MESEASTPLLTVEQVRAWVAERRELASALERMDRKLEGVRMFLPAETANALLGPITVATKSAAKSDPEGRVASWNGRRYTTEPLTDIALRILAEEKGGRTTAAIRKIFEKDPALAERLKSPTALSNALSRLKERGQLLHRDGGYYHPDVWAAIQSGSFVEEQEENTEQQPTFSSRMYAAVEGLGGPFTAAEAVQAAREDPVVSKKLETNSQAIYAWLSREVFKKKIGKDGEHYLLPSQRNGALNGNAASAPFAGRGATLPFESRDPSQDHG